MGSGLHELLGGRELREALRRSFSFGDNGPQVSVRQALMCSISHPKRLKPSQNLTNISQVIDDGQSNFRGSTYSIVLLSFLLSGDATVSKSFLDGM